MLIRFWRARSGATSIEYGLVVGLICLAIVSVVSTIGTRLADNYYVPMARALN